MQQPIAWPTWWEFMMMYSLSTWSEAAPPTWRTSSRMTVWPSWNPCGSRMQLSVLNISSQRTRMKINKRPKLPWRRSHLARPGSFATRSAPSSKRQTTRSLTQRSCRTPLHTSGQNSDHTTFDRSYSSSPCWSCSPQDTSSSCSVRVAQPSGWMH